MPVSALLTAEDITQTEHLRRLEVEAANLRLIKSMADRLAHEIGNAMVPLSTHQQLLAEKYNDKEFRKSLDTGAGRRRQARHAAAQSNAFPRAGRAFRARGLSHRTVAGGILRGSAQTSARRTFEVGVRNNGGAPIIVTGDRLSLKHAFAEIILNALQANLKEPNVTATIANGFRKIRLRPSN